MMCYKDITFCPAVGCANYNCDRHRVHIEEAQKDGGYLQVNNWIPISWFVTTPAECKEFIPIDKVA